MDVAVVQELPASSLLHGYRQRRAYTDGFSFDVPFAVTLGDYIDAFYTTPLFKLERLTLAALVAKPSLDRQAAALAVGDSDKFAVWTVEARTADQIILCDFLSKTRSWLMCAPNGTGGTRLYFGTVIVPKRILPGGRVDLGIGFHLLLPFHKVYARALLRAAARRLIKRHKSR